MENSMLDLNKARDAHIDQRLHDELMIWLSTVRPDGRPHIVPVWFLWEDQTILIFSQQNAQKLRNLRHNPNVALALDMRNEGSDIVFLEGRAELVNDPNVNATLPAFAQKYASQFVRLTPESMAQEYSQAIRISPTKIYGWNE
jgi:PPOX class probable F420-dependent enzyme